MVLRGRERGRGGDRGAREKEEEGVSAAAEGGREGRCRMLCRENLVKGMNGLPGECSINVLCTLSGGWSIHVHHIKSG